jgi:hypothetical protein
MVMHAHTSSETKVSGRSSRWMTQGIADTNVQLRRLGPFGLIAAYEFTKTDADANSECCRKALEAIRH